MDLTSQIAVATAAVEGMRGPLAADAWLTETRRLGAWVLRHLVFRERLMEVGVEVAAV